MRRSRFALVLAVLSWASPAWMLTCVAAEKPAVVEKPAAAPNTPAPTQSQPDVKPYDPQLLHLAEILGALSYLRGLCDDKHDDDLRGRMQALLDAEGTTPLRKDRLAGAFNSGIDGYALSYRTCTPNARLAIDRFLIEASRIAKAIENQFGAT